MVNSITFDCCVKSWELIGKTGSTDSALFLSLVNTVGSTDDLRKLCGCRVRIVIERKLEVKSCPRCGCELIWDKSCPWSMRIPEVMVRCSECGARGKGETEDDALDALKLWQETIKCPNCGGVIRPGVTLNPTGSDSKTYVRCLHCGASGFGSTQRDALNDLAKRLDKCPRCGGESEYVVNVMNYREWQASCRNKDCRLRSPWFDTEREVARWWNKKMINRGSNG